MLSGERVYQIRTRIKISEALSDAGVGNRYNLRYADGVGMDVGYIRTSKKDQNPELQRRDLEAIGCERIYEEQVSSRKEGRPELRAALDYCREGDRLVVWKLDRLGRSLRELIDSVNALGERGAKFVSLRESIDTTTLGGRLVFDVFASVAEFERDLIRERTMVGLEAARARGRKGGRKRALDDRQVAMARRMMADREASAAEVARAFGVSKPTLYRYLRKEPVTS